MKKLSLDYLGIINPKNVYYQLSPAQLTEKALLAGEGQLSDTGALCVMTGKYTGRSPNDRFIVDEPAIHDDIDWGKINVPISPEKFDSIYMGVTSYLQGRDVYVFDGYAGADPDYRVNFRIVNDLASENMFIHQLLIRPEASELENFVPGFTIVAAPGYKCIPERDGVNSEAAIIVNFTKKIVLIAGSQYAGEIKKSVFSVMNYLMPQKDVFPMHCSANVDPVTGESALFFGLSGTGKTTLSADPNRNLIGDDEHGWSPNGIFNFEGGCYAKTIKLSKEHEPDIWNAIKFGSLVENVIIDPETRVPDYDDGSVTENTRTGYPINYINNAQIPSVAGHPKTVIFLTADAFGVLPPISKLNRESAKYQFVSGFTSKLAGTERGIDEPTPTFSTCFGAPFLPRPASLYAEMLGKKIDEFHANVFLVNTGWSGGPANGEGRRMSLPYTRAMITAALNGSLDKVEYRHDDTFNVDVPVTCPGVPDKLLNPRETWTDKAAYDETAKKLAGMFVKNFKKYTDMPEAIINAGPKA
ncbi:MAG: phosphoenolpyruvate carboxykinase (ATP) [Clostridia bacterium]|nr:phosphoenolpyruvate carboxykinase (ATP) [Clostridia bacterium]